MKSWFAGVMAWGRTCLGKIFQKIMKKYNFWGRHDDIYKTRSKPGSCEGRKEAGCSRDLDQEK